MKILVVDDETVILEEIALELQDDKHEVVTAVNGRQAYDLYAKDSQTFDLVLTDVKMPVMDGLELLKQIKQQEPEMPVMIMSGHGDLAIAITALKLGAVDFIVKPFRLETLRKTLDAAMSRITKFSESKLKPLEILPYVEPIRLKIPSQTEFIPKVVSYFQNQIDPICKLHKLNSYGISLALHEALANAVIHGNLEIPSNLKETSWPAYEQMLKEREATPAFREKTVMIQYQGTTAGISFEIEDQGAGFNYRKLPDFRNPDNFLCSGRGIALISVYMDEVSWNEAGNRIRIVKHFKKITIQELAVRG